MSNDMRGEMESVLQTLTDAQVCTVLAVARWMLDNPEKRPLADYAGELATAVDGVDADQIIIRE